MSAFKKMTCLMRPFLAIATLMATASCTGFATTHPGPPANPQVREISFTTTEFTRPRISMSSASDIIYFDVLGEIYRVGLEGGRAEKMELGPGWKDLPVVSPDGAQLAFRSDGDGLPRVWVKTLSSGDGPVSASGDGSIDPLDFIWGRGGTIVWSGQYNLTASRSPYDLSVSSTGRASLSSHLAGQPDQWPPPGLVGASGDGRHVYLHNGVDGLRVVDSLTGSETDLSKMLSPEASQVRLSPDGTFVGYTDDLFPNVLSVVELATGERTVTGCPLEETLREDGDQYVAPTFALADGARFAIVAKDGKLQKCSLDGALEVLPVEVEVVFRGDAMLKPDYGASLLPQILYPSIATVQGMVAFSMADRIWLQDLKTGALNRFTSKDAFETMPAFSRSGNRLAYVEVDDGISRLMVADVRTGNVEVVDESRTMVHANPAWAHCECRVAFSLADTRPVTPARAHVSKLMVLDLEKREVTHVADVGSVIGMETYHAAPQWDADDSGLFYIVGRSMNGNDLVHHPFGGEPLVVMRMDPEIVEIRLSPDYRSMALRYRDGIAVAPFALVSSKDRQLAYTDLKALVHPFRGAADFVVWADEGTVAWVVQNRLHAGRENGAPVHMATANLPGDDSSSDLRKVAYVGGRIISMRGDEIIEDGVVVTAGAKIIHVGRHQDSAIPDDAEIVEVSGKTIIPGMVDVHQHPHGDNYGNEPVTGGFLYSLAAWGVTTAFDPAAGSLPQANNLSFLSARDDYQGATYYSAGSTLLAPAGHHKAVYIDELDDARAYVSRNALAGVPLVKEYLGPNRRHRRLVVQAARELGLGVVSHQNTSRRVHLSTIADGYTAIEHEFLMNMGHGKPFYSDVVELLARSGVSLTPTLVEPLLGFVSPHMDSITPRNLRYKCLLGQRYHERVDRSRMELAASGEGTGIPSWASRRFAKQADLLKSGVLVSVGSHGPPHGLSTHWELWALSQGGASPLEAIRAATMNGAIKMNLQNRIGSLEVGKDADLVILNSNPVDSISNTADIWRVVRRGRPLEWRVGTRWPLSSDVQADWSECHDWGM